MIGKGGGAALLIDAGDERGALLRGEEAALAAQLDLAGGQALGAFKSFHDSSATRRM
jgi:hypothetical protein